MRFRLNSKLPAAWFSAMTVLCLIGSAPTVDAQDLTFSNLQDLVPNRAFNPATSIANDNNLTIGLESGNYVIPGTFSVINKAFVAATYFGYSRLTSDTIFVTVTAPPGRHIASITYAQTGSRVLSRGYFSADGSGTLTVNNAPLPFTFQHPNLSKTVNLTGQNLNSVTVSVAVQLRCYRNSSFPRVTAPPGGSYIDIQNAVISAVLE